MAPLTLPALTATVASDNGTSNILGLSFDLARVLSHRNIGAVVDEASSHPDVTLIPPSEGERIKDMVKSFGLDFMTVINASEKLELVQHLVTSNVAVLADYESEIILRTLRDLRLDSQLYIYQSTAKGYKLYEMYVIKKEVTVLQRIGEWTDQSGLHLYDHNIFSRRSDLRGVQLVDSVLPTSMLSLVTSADDRDNVIERGGYFSDVLSVLSDRLNFTIRTVLPADRKYGGMKSDGVTRAGIIGMLANGEADISSGGMTITEHRMKAVDYSRPVGATRKTLITRADSGAAPAVHFWVYVGIFPKSVWFAAAVGLFLQATAFYAIDGVPGNAFAAVGLTAIQLSSDSVIKFTRGGGRSAKATYLTTSFLCFLLFTYYTCDLTSIMTVQPARRELISFRDAHEKGFTVIVAQGSGSQENLATAA